MVMGPWFFRNQALLMEGYDGFQNPRAVVLNKLAVWAQVHKLTDGGYHGGSDQTTCMVHWRICEASCQDESKPENHEICVNNEGGEKEWNQVK